MRPARCVMRGSESGQCVTGTETVNISTTEEIDHGMSTHLNTSHGPAHRASSHFLLAAMLNPAAVPTSAATQRVEIGRFTSAGTIALQLPKFHEQFADGTRISEITVAESQRLTRGQAQRVFGVRRLPNREYPDHDEQRPSHPEPRRRTGRHASLPPRSHQGDGDWLLGQAVAASCGCGRPGRPRNHQGLVRSDGIERQPVPVPRRHD